jgi:DNA integrity scanning protein DisA with diadenylate cyclase activity
MLEQELRKGSHVYRDEHIVPDRLRKSTKPEKHVPTVDCSNLLMFMDRCNPLENRVNRINSKILTYFCKLMATQHELETELQELETRYDRFVDDLLKIEEHIIEKQTQLYEVNQQIQDVESSNAMNQTLLSSAEQNLKIILEKMNE